MAKRSPEIEAIEGLAGGDVSVKSADRVLDLFELLDGWAQGMSHTEIADELKIPKSSLSQLLKTLIARGYISYVPEHKSYCLGERFAEFAQHTSQARNLVRLAKPRLIEITRITLETSALNVLHGDSIQIAAAEESSHALVTQMRLGGLAPLYATSGGKAILAFMPEQFQQEYLARVKFNKITPHTLTSRAQVQGQLERIRRDRLAESHEEIALGIIGFAVPILTVKDKVLGALILALPTVRYSASLRNFLVNTLRSAVADLENQLKKTQPTLIEAPGNPANDLGMGGSGTAMPSRKLVSAENDGAEETPLRSKRVRKKPRAR
jgi:DNA-binding IclR family transcriptional regulator